MKQRQSAMVLIIMLTIPATVLGYWYYSSFNRAVLYPLPSEPMDVAIGDINGDGNPDVVVASRNGKALSIFHGNGSGALKHHEEISLPLGATSLVITDLNSDGVPDLAVTVCNQDCAHSGVLAFTGAGGGDFDEPVDFTISGTPSRIAAADFNRDGRVDLVTTNLGISQVTFLMSKGTGEFEEWGLDTEEPPVALSVADFNGDSAPDVVVVNKRDRSVSLFANTSDKEMNFTRRDLPIHSVPTDVELQDFNKDGKIDLGVTHATHPGKLSIFWGAGNGYFKRKDTVKTESIPIAVKGRDFDNDGFNDLLVLRKHKKYALLHLNNGEGRFTEKAFQVQMGTVISSVEVADMNNDSIPDIATLCSNPPSLSIAMGATNN